jgi:uncharacterized membrane protein YfcA
MTFIESATGLTPAAIGLAAAMTFGAAAIRGLTGFGMAIILVPLLGLVIRPDQAVVLAILLQFLIGPVGIKTIIADSDRSSSLMIAGFAVLATPFGLRLLAHTAPDLARLLISLVAIGAFILVVMPKRQSAAPGRAATAATGIASGILTGFAAMPGPPVVPYYLRGAFSPVTARASMMLIFFATAIAGTISSTLLGLTTVPLMLIALALFVPMFVGNHLGQMAFGRVSPTLWRSMVALLLGIAGVAALIRLL